MKTLTLVIPMYNESKRLSKLFTSLKKGIKVDGINLEKVIFVDDGSRDKTVLKVQDFIQANNLPFKAQLLSYSPNKGRGHAVRLGLLHSLSDYTLYLDADSSIPLSNLESFAKYMEKDYDLLFGSKKAPGVIELKPRGLVRKIVGLGHSLIASLFLGVFAWDFQGGFKMFSRRFIEEVTPLCHIDKWGFDMEVVFWAKKLDYSKVELPIVWKPIENGSKVSLLRDIWLSLQDILTIKLDYLNFQLNNVLRLKTAHEIFKSK